MWITYNMKIEENKNKEIVKLKKSGKNMAEIGRMYKISRERVRQICNEFPKKEKREIDKAIELLNRYKKAV